MIKKPQVHTNFELTKDYVRRLATALNRILDDDFWLEMTLSIFGAGVTYNEATKKIDVVFSDDVEVTTIGKGVIIKSPNGTRWRLTPTNAGSSLWTVV